MSCGGCGSNKRKHIPSSNQRSISTKKLKRNRNTNNKIIKRKLSIKKL